MRSFLLTLSLLLALPVSAATYYFDYATGSDANNGTSKSTPWKHHPSMEPFSGSYTHVAGDQFIFKGGVTWPNAALPMYIRTGGTAGNLDYYGVDQTWFTGASWARPIFDGGGVNFENHDAIDWQNLIHVRASTSRFNHFDNLEITNWLYTNWNTANSADGSGIFLAFTGDILMTNLYIHDWVVETTSEGSAGIKIMDTLDGAGASWAIDCEIRGPVVGAEWRSDPNGTTAGVGTYGVSTLRCDISQVTQGIWGGSSTFDNRIHDACDSFVSSAHENGIRIHGNAHVRGNVLWNLVEGTGVFLIPGWDGNSIHRRIWCYNNVFIDTPQLNVCSGDKQISPNTNEGWFVNNIIVNAYTSVGSKEAPTEGPVVRANNIFIDDFRGLGPSAQNTPYVLITDFTCLNEINSNNVVISTATAAAYGMTFENFYRPTAEVMAELIGQGLDFSGNPLAQSSPSRLTFTIDFDGETRTAPWDLGAYVLDGDPPVDPGSLTLSAQSYTGAEDVGNLVFTVNRVGGTDGAVGVSYATSDGTAGQPGDYTSTSGTLSWTNGDNAPKTISVPIIDDEDDEGDESFMLTISSATGGASLGGTTSASGIIEDNDDAAAEVPTMADLGPFEAESGLVEGIFTVSGGFVYQTVQTTDPANGGLVRYQVPIPSAGNYKVTMDVDMADGASNSAFVDWDQEPTDPDAVWDEQTLTDGTEARDVTWRGDGAFDNPEFVPQVWALTEATHTLYIRGREANAKIDTITVVEVGGAAPTAPSSPAVALTGTRYAPSITLTWSDDASTETGYHIERSEFPYDEFLVVTTTAADVETYEDEAIDLNTSYRYRIRAVNANGNSDYTSEVEQRTIYRAQRSGGGPALLHR
jgi:hypothetical protein